MYVDVLYEEYNLCTDYSNQYTIICAVVSKGQSLQHLRALLLAPWWQRPDHINQGSVKSFNMTIAHRVICGCSGLLHTSNFQEFANQLALKCATLI